jgi:hypothetical protein
MVNTGNHSSTAPVILNRSNTITSVASTGHSVTQTSYLKMLLNQIAQKSQQTTAANANLVHLICNKCGVNISNRPSLQGDRNELKKNRKLILKKTFLLNYKSTQPFILLKELL